MSKRTKRHIGLAVFYVPPLVFLVWAFAQIHWVNTVFFFVVVAVCWLWALAITKLIGDRT